MADKTMDATIGGSQGTSAAEGETTDGEATAGRVGSTYGGTLVERTNKAVTRDQTPGRAPMMSKDIAGIKQGTRKTGRVNG